MEKKQISEAKIVKKYVKKRPRRLKDNQLYFESGYWDGMREVIFPSICRFGNKIVFNIQKKLNEYGYHLELTDELNDKTKAAIIDFQKQHGLPVGQIDFDLLRALGVEY